MSVAAIVETFQTASSGHVVPGLVARYLPPAGRRAAAVLAVLVAACGAAVPAVPSKGGPAWYELTSEHFTVWTDAPDQRARELVREMERLRQLIVGVAFPSAPAGGRNFVVVLRDDGELAAFSPTGEPRPFAVSGAAPLWQPIFVVSAQSNRDPGDHAVAHELTHVISYAVVHHQPRWFAEGMAQFFETVDINPDSTTADIGAAPSYRGQPIQMAHLGSVPKLLTWRGISEGERSEYSTAWALFTFLINEHRAELVRYMQLLDEPADEKASPGEVAARQWREAFPSVPLGEVTAALQQWLLSGHHRVVHVNIQLRAWPVTVRKLGDADVYATRGLLRSLMANQDAQRRADVDAALAAEPTNVLGWVLRWTSDDAKPTSDQGRAITAAHPEDWRAWLLAAVALQSAGGAAEEIESARTRCCELAANNPALTVPSGLCGDLSAARSP
jgi:hypothetical protein